MSVKNSRAIKQMLLANTCLYVTHTVFYVCLYSRIQLISINWGDEASRYAKNPDNWIFFENRLHWPFEVEKIATYLFTDK